MEKETKKDITVLVRAEVSKDGSVVNIKTTLHKNKAKAFNALKDCMFKGLKRKDFMEISGAFGRGIIVRKGNSNNSTIKKIFKICTLQKHWGIIYVDADDGLITIDSQADTQEEINMLLVEVLSMYKTYIGKGDYNICNWGEEHTGKNNFPDVYKIFSV